MLHTKEKPYQSDPFDYLKDTMIVQNKTNKQGNAKQKEKQKQTPLKKYRCLSVGCQKQKQKQNKK